MNILMAFSMALKTIRRKKVRSALTMLGIVIGITAVIVMVSLVQGMQKQVRESFEKMGTNTITLSYWSANDLSQKILQKCSSMDDLIIGITPAQQDWGKTRYLKKETDTSIYYGNEDFAVCNNWTITSGRMLTQRDCNTRARVTVIGSALKEQLFNYTDPIGKSILIKGESFEVVGVFEMKYSNDPGSMDAMCAVPYTQTRLFLKTTTLNNFTLKAKDADSTDAAVEKLQNFMRSLLSQDWRYSVYSQNSYIEQSNQTMNMISLVLGGIAGISLLVGGIGIMNIMLVSVTERTREIGIRKAIGARRKNIAAQFLIESATVSAIGGIVGILLGYLLTLVLGKLFIKIILFPDPMITVGAALFSIAIGVFFGLYPATRAAKLSPIEALRNE